MKILIPLLGFIYFANNSSAQVKTPAKIKFSYVITDSSRDSYVSKDREGASIIDLYMDSVFTFYAFSPVENQGKFSSGTWRIQQDSILVLTTDKSIFESTFNRQKRSEAINRHSFIMLDHFEFLLKNRQVIYAARKRRGE